MRVILVGGGKIGFGLAQKLAIGHEVFVIDHVPEIESRFESLDVQFVLGTGTSAEVLGRAGADRADVLVACTGSDEVNLVSCAIARQLGSPKTFCLVSREDFFSIADQRGLLQFGIDRLIWPEAQLSADIERIIRSPGAVDAEVFAHGAVRLIEYQLQADAPVQGQRIVDMHLPHGAVVVAVRRAESFFIPRGDSQLLAGDRVIVMGTPDALGEVRQRLTGAADPSRQRVTIIGGGDVGLRLAERLDLDESLSVTIIERDLARGEFVASRLRRALVLTGDGTDLELLESEDIGRSDVLVSVIDNDERNLFASLLARQLGVRRVITRVSKQVNLRLFELVGIDVAISARGAAVASLLHRIEGGATRLLAVVEQGAGRILELIVPDGYAPRTLRKMAPPRESVVGAVIREGTAVVPRGDHRIEPGDHLIVFCTDSAAEQVRDFFTGVKA